jgi:HK97 gp10 family phage protein
MGASFEFDGMEQIQRRLAALGADRKKVENKAILAGAELLAEKMREEVPVSDINHVHIRDDIQVSKVKRKDGVPFVEVGPGKETNWRAKFIELGTSKLPANPFITRSVRLTKEPVKSKLKNELKSGLGL